MVVRICVLLAASFGFVAQAGAQGSIQANGVPSGNMRGIASPYRYSRPRLESRFDHRDDRSYPDDDRLDYANSPASPAGRSRGVGTTTTPGEFRNLSNNNAMHSRDNSVTRGAIDYDRDGTIDTAASIENDSTIPSGAGRQDQVNDRRKLPASTRYSMDPNEVRAQRSRAIRRQRAEQAEANPQRGGNLAIDANTGAVYESAAPAAPRPVYTDDGGSYAYPAGAGGFAPGFSNGAGFDPLATDASGDSNVNRNNGNTNAGVPNANGTPNGAGANGNAYGPDSTMSSGYGALYGQGTAGFGTGQRGYVPALRGQGGLGVPQGGNYDARNTQASGAGALYGQGAAGIGNGPRGYVPTPQNQAQRFGAAPFGGANGNVPPNAQGGVNASGAGAAGASGNIGAGAGAGGAGAGAAGSGGAGAGGAAGAGSGGASIVKPKHLYLAQVEQPSAAKRTVKKPPAKVYQVQRPSAQDTWLPPEPNAENIRPGRSETVESLMGKMGVQQQQPQGREWTDRRAPARDVDRLPPSERVRPPDAFHPGPTVAHGVVNNPHRLYSNRARSGGAIGGSTFPSSGAQVGGSQATSGYSGLPPGSLSGQNPVAQSGSSAVGATTPVGPSATPGRSPSSLFQAGSPSSLGGQPGSPSSTATIGSGSTLSGGINPGVGGAGTGIGTSSGSGIGGGSIGAGGTGGAAGGAGT